MNSIFNKLNKMQDEAIRKAEKSLRKEGKALLQMATGTGKTETAIKLIKKMNFDKVLWLTHQVDLVYQSAERFIKYGLEDVTLYTGSHKDVNGQIVVSTVQTIGRKNHLESLSPEVFDAIVVDEAHHAPAEQWVKVIKYFKNAKRIALTATPYRPDGKTTTAYENGVFDLFGEPVFKLNFESAVDNKYIAKPISTIVLTNSVLNGLKINQHDWTPEQLEKLYTSMDRNRIILKTYKKIRKEVKNPKAVCFCINIQHAKRMSEFFKASGFKAEFICSDSNYQPAEQRKNIMEKYRNSNQIEIICAVNIFNEGVDIPEANIALLTRPTSSNIIYQQQVGRVARTNNGKKKEFHVIDFVDNTGKKYGGYVLNNIYSKGASSHKRIITEYINEPDPVVVKGMVDNIMKRVMEFEDEQHKEYQNHIIKNIKEKNIVNFLKTKEWDKEIYND